MNVVKIRKFSLCRKDSVFSYFKLYQASGTPLPLEGILYRQKKIIKNSVKKKKDKKVILNFILDLIFLKILACQFFILHLRKL